MNDAAINSLLLLMALPEFNLYTRSRKEFERRSYTLWAITEILEAIQAHPTVMADLTIYEFQMKMMFAYQKATSSMAKRIFQIAVDTAEMALSYI